MEGQKDRGCRLSPKLLEILRAWWRVEKLKGWLFPGDRVGSYVTGFTVEQACQQAHQRCDIRSTNIARTKLVRFKD
jgi:integrase/recombinase XerD